MTHTFVVNTENVNEYGYRILTDGIDTDQFMRNPVVLYYHERARHPKQVVGRVLKLYKKDNDLLADVEFDVEDEYAAELAGKVERGYIRMCSLQADVIESSTDAKLLLPGQTLETVTKCKLVEISIVDIGGNGDALKLSRDGQPIQLKKIELNKKEDMSFKTIALALAMTESATEAEVLAKVNTLTLAKEAADAKVIALTQEIKDIQVQDAEILIDKAVALGLFPEALKASQLAAFDKDYNGQKAMLSKMVTDKEAEAGVDGKQETLKEIALAGKGQKPNTTSATGENSFDYLQKHNVVELRRLQKDEPTKYAELAKGYAEGVRYVKA